MLERRELVQSINQYHQRSCRIGEIQDSAEFLDQLRVVSVTRITLVGDLATHALERSANIHRIGGSADITFDQQRVAAPGLANARRQLTQQCRFSATRFAVNRQRPTLVFAKRAFDLPQKRFPADEGVCAVPAKLPVVRGFDLDRLTALPGFDLARDYSPERVPDVYAEPFEIIARRCLGSPTRADAAQKAAASISAGRGRQP
jgi:hypothetical protein